MMPTKTPPESPYVCDMAVNTRAVRVTRHGLHTEGKSLRRLLPLEAAQARLEGAKHA